MPETSDPSEDDVAWQAVHDSMLDVMRAADEHFGDHEPTEEELHAFLRQRLLAGGKTEAEADALLRDL